jgi:dTDP-4-dehydrorhamnose reductase
MKQMDSAIGAAELKSQRVLITGCGGMLGSAIYPYFSSRYGTVIATDKLISEDWLKLLDVRDYHMFDRYFEIYAPDLVLHLAAETDLEYCETHPDVANAVNALATRHIAEVCAKHSCPLVYISTAGVFDGLKEGAYTEDDLAKPIMVYGKAKLEGEEYVENICEKYLIVRAGWMVGGGLKKDHKFVSFILNQIVEGRTVIHAVNDRWGTPTYTDDFSRNLLCLIQRGVYGRYHMVCEGGATRLDVAAEILRILSREDIELVPVSSEFFAQQYFAPRPRSEMMVNANLEKLGLNLMRPWQVALRDYLYNQYGHIFIDRSRGKTRLINLR